MYLEDAALSSPTLSNVFVRERMRRSGNPTKLDFRTGSVVAKVSRRCCCCRSSCRDPADEDTVAVLARRKDCARRRALEPLGSLAAQKSLDTDMPERLQKQNAEQKELRITYLAPEDAWD